MMCLLAIPHVYFSLHIYVMYFAVILWQLPLTFVFIAYFFIIFPAIFTLFLVLFLDLKGEN